MHRSENPTLMLFTHFDRVLIAVHDAVPPTDEEWESWLELFRGRTQALVLVESFHGAGPNAKQRKMLGERMQGIELGAAIMTDSTVTRGIVTALSWLGMPQRAFLPGNYYQAGKYLGLTNDELARAVDELRRLQTDMNRAHEVPAQQ
jgi:hypothetical protein